MANVGSAAAGKTLIGAGNGASPTYADIGTNSGLTDHGVIIAKGTAAFVATAAGTAGQVLQSGGGAADPLYSTATYPGASGTSGNVITSNGTNFVSQALPAPPGTTLTNHSVALGTGTANLSSVGPSATSGQILQSAGASADPVFSTATYPATSGTTGTILRSNGTNFVNTTATYPTTTTINQILYSSAGNVIGGITAAANGVLISSNTNVPSWLANSGTPGFVLTANAGAPPSWQAGGGGAGITTIEGDTGTPTTGPTVPFHGGMALLTSNGLIFDIDALGTVSLNYAFLNLPESNVTGQGIIYMEDVVDRYTFMHAFSTSGVLGGQNTFLGRNAGNITSTGGSSNTGVGALALNALDTGSGNTIVGSGAGQLMDDGSENSGFGEGSLLLCSSGSFNTGLGAGALNNLDVGTNNLGVGITAGTGITSGTNNTLLGNYSYANGNGNFNTCVGDSAGSSLTGTDSDNTLINHLGVSGDNNVLRIGLDGTGDGNINQAFIAGIDGRTVTGTAVLISSVGELGTIVSSRKYKENIKDIDKDISVLKLRPVEFNYNELKNKKGECAYKQYGLIAEEVHETFPYLCFYKNGQPESVKYHEIPVLLLHEIQKLKAEIEELKKSIVRV